MYAIGRIADAIIIPPIPSPRPGTRPAGEADAGHQQVSRQRPWRRLAEIAGDAWLSFVPRLRNDPR